MTIVRTLVRWAAPFLILGVGIGIFLALGKQSPPPRAPVTTVEAVPVETAAVLPEEKGIDISTDGVVVPIREVTLAAEVGGRIIMKSPACESGEYVKEGTLLLQIDPRDYELDVERLQREVKQASLAIEEVDEEVKQNASSLDLAKKQVELAHREVMRLDGLTAEGIVTKSTYDLAVRDELTASNTLNGLQGKQRVLAKRRNRFVEAKSLAETNLKRAELDLARTKVTTPLTGMVVDELAEEDSFVSKGMPLVTVEDTSAAEVKLSLRMHDVARLWSGRNAVEATDAGPFDLPPTRVTVMYTLNDQEYQWQGVLTRQEGRGLDQKTRTLPCRVLVNDPAAVKAIDRYGAIMPQLPAGAPRTLMRGMFVEIRVHVESASGLVSIPEEAQRPTGEVWVMRNGKLVIVKPRPLAITGGRVIFDGLASGLLPGDRVVTSQLTNVRDGMAIVEVPRPDREATRPARLSEPRDAS